MSTVAPPSSVPHAIGSPWRRRAWLGLALVLLVLFWCFGLVALRPLVQAVVQHRSGRTIDFSALHIGLDSAFQPRIAFADLKVGNAAWAVSHEPMVRGAKVVFEFDWSGLRTGTWLIQRLVLEDAEIDLERRADGLRNSRLWDPQGNGPARTRILRVDAQRSRLRYADAVTGFRLDIRSASLAAPRPLTGHPDRRLTRRLTFEGVRRGIAFSGTADVDDTLSLQLSGSAFGLEGEARVAGLALQARGLATDVIALGGFDTDVQLDVLPQAAPRAAPFDWLAAPLKARLQGHLVHDAGRWDLTRLQWHGEHTDAEGSLSWRAAASSTSRATLTARIDARRLDASDLRPARPARVASAASAAAFAAAASSAASEPEPRRLDTLDADLDLHIGQLFWAGTALAHEARAHARLAQGRLAVELSEVQVAEGRASGTWNADTSRTPTESTVALRLTGLRLDRLPWTRPHKPLPAGRLDARAALRARGRTATELLQSSSGTVTASLSGASVPQRLEAELGLDGVALLRSLVAGQEQVPLRCAELAVALANGRGTIRHLALDTPRTAVAGSGSVDLVAGRLNVLLSPSSNVGALLTLPRDIHVTGTFKAPEWSLQARDKAATAQRCGAAGN